jgi:two-component system, NarL family, response regulator NreC
VIFGSLAVAANFRNEVGQWEDPVRKFGSLAHVYCRVSGLPYCGPVLSPDKLRHASAYAPGMTARLHLAPVPARTGTLAEPLIKVVLADDHEAVRRNLKLVLDREDDFQVVAEAADLSTVLRHVPAQLPHVLVLDLRMPEGSSIETIRRLRAQVPDTEIVVLTMEHSPAFAQQALDAGAVGFVLKDKADHELPEAVRRASRGEEYISARIAAGLDALRRLGDGKVLTPRETEVLRLIALGFTSAEIAQKLHLSRRTVETHRARIHRKLGAETRAQLVSYALRNHLMSV